MELKYLNAAVRGAKVLNDVLNAIRSMNRSVYASKCGEKI